jgi:hypothetical protein
VTRPPLFALTEERIRAEIARARHEEFAHQREQRQVWAMAAAVALGDLASAFFFALSMHWTGDAAQAAKYAAMLCAPAPVIVIVLWQLRREAER